MVNRELQTIVVVDNAPLGISLVSQVVKELGFPGTVLGTNVDDARFVLGKNPSTLGIICRLTTGGENRSYILLRDLRKPESHFRRTPTLALTYRPDSNEAQACARMGIIIASLDLDDLEEKIRTNILRKPA